MNPISGNDIKCNYIKLFVYKQGKVIARFV